MPTKKQAAAKKAAPKKAAAAKKAAPVESTPTESTRSTQQTREDDRLAALQAERDEHNRRTAGGDAA